MLCADIRTETVKHKIYLLTSALNHIGHVHNGPRSESWSRCTRYVTELPIDNVLILSNLHEYGHERHIAKN